MDITILGGETDEQRTTKTGDMAGRRAGALHRGEEAVRGGREQADGGSHDHTKAGIG